VAIIQRSGNQVDSAQNWDRVRGTETCPVCGCTGNSKDTKGCIVRVDRQYVYCGGKRIDHKTADGPRKQNDGGQWLYRHPDATPGFEDQQLRPILKLSLLVPMKRWRNLAETAYRCDREKQITRLSNQLGVPGFALDSLGFGHLEKSQWRKELNSTSIPCNAWCCPERDAFGEVLGILTRLEVPEEDGNVKKFVYGGSRGLYHPKNLLSMEGPTVVIDGKEVQPILIPEGPTDTAALLSISVPAVGRMNNLHGVDAPNAPPQLLNKIFADTARPAVILCDNDSPKENGSRPGFDGGVRTAQKLANALRRAVYWTMPPDNAKDARSWLNKHLPDAAGKSKEYLAPIGTCFFAALEFHRADPEGQEVAPYEPPGDIETELQTFRDQSARDRVASLDGSDINVTTGPCGAGKTHDDLIALEMFDADKHRTAFIVPTHANVKAALEEYRVAMPSMVAYPRIEEDNCHPAKYPDVKRSRKIALAPGMSCCIGCEFRKGCKFQQQLKRAKKANHVIMTRSMAAYQPSLLSDRNYISVHEDPLELFKGHVKVATSDDRELDLVGRMLLDAASKEKEKLNWDKPSVDHEMIQFLDAMEQLAVWLQDQANELATGDHSTQRLKVPPRFEYIPEHWHMKLGRLCQGIITDASRQHVVNVNRNAAELVYKLATGEVTQLVLQVDKPKRDKKTDHNSDVNVVYIVATWDQPGLPARPTKWIADATLRVDLVKELTQQKVIDRTPAGRLPRHHSLRQIDWDVTQRTSPKKVAAMLLAIVDAHKECSRFGLITQQKHVKALFDKHGSSYDELDHETRALFHKVVYFGQGPDRADNSWYRECDFLIVLGTPRPNPSDVMTRLIVLGDLESATDPDLGSWGPRDWEGATADDTRLLVSGYGYAAPAWRQAYEDITHAMLLQAAGRTRSILEDGIPGLVCTNENLGRHMSLVDPGQYPMASKAVREAAQEVCRYCASAIDISTIGKAQTRQGASTEDVAAVLGKSNGQTTRLLNRAAAAGLVVRSDAWKGGWLSYERELAYRAAEQKAERELLALKKIKQIFEKSKALSSEYAAQQVETSKA